ncbi:MAG: cysteine synthase family protein [Peptoniphilaceae bacterium]|nr:cysteine synthase family protein [Peptoniphilaceae bacterium]MDY3075777.1 cysteine synthase family protein [Peptoniphilaceae bacterium]
MKIIETIGGTPLVQLQHIGEGRIFVKLEKTNPGGSIKDRPALRMIQDAIERGDLRPGMKIVEPTSGNTGVALSIIGKSLGYEVEIYMPASMSVERVRMMESFGAKVILVTEGGLQGAVNQARAEAAKGNAYMPDQFSNPSNVKAHEISTGPEIIKALPDVAGFVAGVGTGGTVTGVGHALKAHDPDVKIYALEPEESPILSRGQAGAHLIQGIAGNVVPKILDRDILDKIISVTSEEALEMARRLSREEGLSVGISSGANVAGALKMLKDVTGKIATVAPDLGERYLSTKLFAESTNRSKESV